MEGENEKGKKGGQGWKEGIYFPLRMASLQIASDQGRGMGSTREKREGDELQEHVMFG